MIQGEEVERLRLLGYGRRTILSGTLIVSRKKFVGVFAKIDTS